jgi:O-antigen ligase
MNATLSRQLDNASRERAVSVIFTSIALAFGAFAALGSNQWHVTLGVLLLISVAALTMPLAWVAPILAALVPLQFYFDIPDSSFTVRGAVVFVFAAALRVFVGRTSVRLQGLKRSLRTWMLPAALFLFAALAAAFGAPNKYLAFKGVYDWLIIFTTAFAISEMAQSIQTLRRLTVVLIAAGVGEALLGLLQYALGLEIILNVLRLPASELFFQPDLLKDKLGDLSFNWMVFDRASPFGTFINGIDYAIFISAILSLALALLLARNNVIALQRTLAMTQTALLVCALLMGGALLLTFKGSGLIAFAGGAVTVALLFGQRVSSRTIALSFVVLVCAIIFVLPFADLIGQRASFLIQREQGAFGTAGRLEIWASLFQFFLQHPLFGFGLNNAILLAEPMRTLRGGVIAFNTTTPESAYVAALIETGAVGFSALMILIVVVLVRAYRNVRESVEPAMQIGVLAAVVALLLGNLTVAGFTTDQNGMLLGVLIGMVFGKWKRP